MLLKQEVLYLNAAAVPLHMSNQTWRYNQNNWRGCRGHLQNAQYAAVSLWSRTHQATAQGGADGHEGGLVLLQTAFHGPLDLTGAKQKSVSIASLNFYLST